MFPNGSYQVTAGIYAPPTQQPDKTANAAVQITDRDIEFYKNDHPEKKWASADDMEIERDIYNERMSQEINNYLLRLRRKAFVEIRE